MKSLHEHFAILLCAALICLLYGASGCSSAGVSLSDCAAVLTDSDNGATPAIAVNKTLCVKLPAQMGTGYSWHVKNAGNALKQKGAPETESIPGKRMPGGAEYQIFRFTAQSKGSADVEIHYLRPWLKEQQPAKVFKCKATVVE